MEFLFGTKLYLELMPTLKFLWLFKIWNSTHKLDYIFENCWRDFILQHFVSVFTEPEMSFWWTFHHWLHRKLPFIKLLVQLVMKISSKWHLNFSASWFMPFGSVFYCSARCYMVILILRGCQSLIMVWWLADYSSPWLKCQVYQRSKRSR